MSHLMLKQTKANLAQGIRFYLFDPEQLIKKDAALYEFLKEKFFNETFWQEALKE